MNINFDSIISTINDDPMKEIYFEDNNKKERDVILKDVCINALLIELKSQNAPLESGRDKFKKYNLAKKISDGGEVELTAEDVILIKDLIGKCYGAAVVGSAWNILDPTSEKKASPTKPKVE